jgi:hypothetical protein
MSQIIPDTDSKEVAMIAAAMFIVDASLPVSSSGTRQATEEWIKRFTETYQAISQATNQTARAGSR